MMNLKSLARKSRLLMLAGAVAFALGIGFSRMTVDTSAKSQTAGLTNHVQVADGSESTSKPPKPKNA